MRRIGTLEVPNGAWEMERPMVTWLNLTPGIRLARNTRSARLMAVGMLVGICFVLAFIF